MKQVKLWTIVAWYLCLFVQNWKCRTSTRGTNPLGILHCHSLPPACWNEELRLSFPLAHSVANGEKRSVIHLVLAHLACRNPPSVCLSSIPAAKTLLVFAGLNRLLPCDHWHLSTAFFSRVQTPCGHGAQVIVEGREERQMVENGTKTPKNQPKPNTQARRPTPPSCSLP